MWGEPWPQLGPVDSGPVASPSRNSLCSIYPVMCNVITVSLGGLPFRAVSVCEVEALYELFKKSVMLWYMPG